MNWSTAAAAHDVDGVQAIRAIDVRFARYADDAAIRANVPPAVLILGIAEHVVITHGIFLMANANFSTFLFEYYHEGSWWLVEVKATNLDDARARMDKMPLAKPLGEQFAKYPARLGWLARASCVVRNFLAPRAAA